MSARDDSNENQPPNELLTNGFHRRNFLKYLGALFAVAALPEAVSSCGAPADMMAGGVGDLGQSVDLSSSTMIWVTRREDGLSLGFQFVNIVADANHNIALSPGAAAGSAYIAITFPPQHVMEDAIAAGSSFSTSTGYPVNARASATSRIVFNVPANYASGAAADAGGIAALPYTLQGVLELCAQSAPVVAPNAMTSAGTNTVIGPVPLDAADKKYESLSQARIDRVISRVDPKAAARVRRRTLRAARMLNRHVDESPAISPLRIVHNGTAPVTPTNGQTSIELPFRIQMSPDETARWSFQSAPVTSPNTLAVDGGRTELWHARMVNPSNAPLTLRALYTRDWDIYGVSNPAGTYANPLPEPADAGPAGAYPNDPVVGANPSAPNREAIVLNTGNMAGSPQLPPLTVNRVILSPAGGTLDVGAAFPASMSPSRLAGWTQNTVLGRDEFVECVNAVTVLPGGWQGTLTTITRRNDDPNAGVVGVLYSLIYLTIDTPLVSYVDVGTPADYNTFPFRALEVTQTRVGCSNAAGASGWVIDPTGKFQVSVGLIGTDWRGNSIKFATPLYVVPLGTGAGAACADWNGGTGAGPGPLFNMDGQRIAFAAPADGVGVQSTSYAPDSTSYETNGFNISLYPPSANATAATAAQVVPRATNLSLSIEAVRHLQSTPTTARPASVATYDYDHVVFAKNGFDPTANPNEIFLTLSNAILASAPRIDFTQNPAQSGGIAAPALSATALSRSAGIVSGTVAAAGASAAASLLSNPSCPNFGSSGLPGSLANIYNGGLNPADIFNAPNGAGLPQLFGFVPLSAIVQGLEGAAAQFMPKAITKELSSAEAFLEKAMALYNVLSGLVSTTVGAVDGAASSGVAGPLQSILAQVAADLSSYSQIAQGVVADGGAIAGGLVSAAGAPLTNADTQAAAWLQSAATQAQDLIASYVTDLTNIFNDAVAVFDAITSLEFDSLIDSTPTGGALGKFMSDLNTFMTGVQTLTSSTADDAGALPSPWSAAGAVMQYFGPVMRPIQGGLDDINNFIKSVEGGIQTILTDLAALSQGLDAAKSMSVEFKWKPVISGLEANEVVAFIPKSNQAFSLDVKVDAHATNGLPAGVNITVRLDSFAICFGQGIPTPASNAPVWTAGPIKASPIACGFSKVQQNADVSLIFDHMQVQMLAGQKPDVDVVFTDIFFGGDLAFVETIKNLIPLDSFSDPPFLNVDSKGITAGFTCAIPNVAIGMFSIQNMSLAASLVIPLVSTGTNGIKFTFSFCSLTNPFNITVAMLGGGGFFSMTMGIDGLESVAMGIQVGAQVALDLVIASGSVSIEVGIFLVYWNPQTFTSGADAGIDPVTGDAKEPGWLIGGYLRLRGELDVAGIITVAVELYAHITYSPSTGKCVASGFIEIDVSLFCFSVSAHIPFSRTFAGSNGDPTLAELMSPGGVDPMLDPTLMSTDAAHVWDPFAEYCMAYA